MILILGFCANGRNQAVAQDFKNVESDNQWVTKSGRAPVWRQGFPRPETDGTLIIPLRSGWEKTLPPKPSESLLNAIHLDNHFRFHRPPDFGADP